MDDTNIKKSNWETFKDLISLLLDFIPNNTLDIFYKILTLPYIYKYLFIFAYVIIIMASITYIILYSIKFYEFSFTTAENKNINNFLLDRHWSILILNILIGLSILVLIVVLYFIKEPVLKKTIYIFWMICGLLLLFLAIIIYYSSTFIANPFGEFFTMDPFDNNDEEINKIITQLFKFKKKYTNIQFSEFFNVIDSADKVNTIETYTKIDDEDNSKITYLPSDTDTENEKNFNSMIDEIKKTIKNTDAMTFLKLLDLSSITLTDDATFKKDFFDNIIILNDHILKYNEKFMKYKLNLNSNPLLMLSLIYSSIILMIFSLVVIKILFEIFVLKK